MSAIEQVNLHNANDKMSKKVNRKRREETGKGRQGRQLTGILRNYMLWFPGTYRFQVNFACSREFVSLT
jgi:hypothetical protein